MTTIETIARDHYLPEKRARRRATTVEGYESSIRLHVLPAFGSMEIAEITRDAVQAWVDSIHGAGAAEKAYKCLRQIIRWAMRRWALQVIDPTVGVELPAEAQYRPACWTPASCPTACAASGATPTRRPWCCRARWGSALASATRSNGATWT